MTHIESLANRHPDVPLTGCDGALDLVRPASAGAVYRCRGCRQLLFVAGGMLIWAGADPAPPPSPATPSLLGRIDPWADN